MDPLELVSTLALLVVAGLSLLGARLSGATDGMRSWSARMGGAAFSAYVLLGIATEHELTMVDVITTVFRGSSVAATVYGTVTVAFVGYTILARQLALAAGEYEHHRRSAQREYEREQQRRQEEQLAAERYARWLEEAPIRAEEARKSDERRRQAEQDQLRRVDARAKCELLYAKLSPEIAGRYARVTLMRFFESYMSDSKPAAEVERRGSELQELLHHHFNCIQPIKSKRSAEDLASWYVAEKNRIEALSVEPDMKEDYLIQLNLRYGELMHELLQKMEP